MTSLRLTSIRFLTSTGCKNDANGNKTTKANIPKNTLLSSDENPGIGPSAVNRIPFNFSSILAGKEVIVLVDSSTVSDSGAEIGLRIIISEKRKTKVTTNTIKAPSTSE